jgi:hypothetical protein
MSKFLTKENLTRIYDLIAHDLKDIQIHLDENDKYKKAVKKLMKSIDKQEHDNIALSDFNTFAISKIKPVLLEMYQKNQGKNVEPMFLGMNDNALGYSLDNSENSDLDTMFGSHIIGDNKVEPDNELSSGELQKKLEEAQNSRGYTGYLNDTEGFRKEVNTANKHLTEEYNKNIKKTSGTKNEFFDNLYGTRTNNLTNIKEESNLSSVYEKNNYSASSTLSRQNPQKNQKEENKKNNPNVFHNDSTDIMKQIVINNKDHSKDNELTEYDPKQSIGEMLTKFNKDNKIQPVLYENTRVGMERINKQIIIIDTGSGSNPLTSVVNLGNTPTLYWHRWKVYFEETFTIDKLSDIYLESMTIVGQTVPDNCLYFSLNIQEFNVIASCNNNNLRNTFVIPNNSDIDLFSSTVVVNEGSGEAVSTGNVTITVDGGSALVFIHVNDSLYLSNGIFLGNIITINTAIEIVLDKLAYPLRDNEILYIGRLKSNVNKYDLASNYIGTLNPKRLANMNFTLTNQEGKSVEDGDNKTFKDKDSSENRIILEFLIVARQSYEDFE